MFDANDHSANPRLIFRPEKLRELGIPHALIDAAAKSDPQGFLLFDDLPDRTHPAKPQAIANSSQLKNTQSHKNKKPKPEVPYGK